MARVIASNFVVLDALIFAMVLVVKVPDPVPEILRLLIWVVVIEGNDLDTLIININDLPIKMPALLFTVFVLVVLAVVFMTLVYINARVPSTNFFALFIFPNLNQFCKISTQPMACLGCLNYILF